MRISSVSFVLVVVAGCAAPPDTRPSPGPLFPQPVAVEASGTLATLIASLGADEFQKRDAAAAELSRLGSRPEDQPSVVLALRSAATSTDAEVRSRARAILSAIDRSEGMIPSGKMSLSFGQGRIEIALRHFADGSVEMTAKVGDGPEELFSGKDMPDLASKVTRAARQRGYSEEVFTMSSDGSFTMGGSTMSLGLNPSEHLLQDFGLWLFQIPESDRSVPDRARGGWRVDARSLDGRGYAAGFRVGDILTQVDGKRPATFDELRLRLSAAKSFTVLRLSVSETELHP